MPNIEIDGLSLHKVLTKGKSSPRKTFFYWAFGELHAVRHKDWKLHILQREPINYENKIKLKTPELYQINADISEKYNVAKDNPKTVILLKNLIERHLNDVKDSFPDQLRERITKK